MSPAMIKINCDLRKNRNRLSIKNTRIPVYIKQISEQDVLFEVLNSVSNVATFQLFLLIKEINIRYTFHYI